MDGFLEEEQAKNTTSPNPAGQSSKSTRSEGKKSRKENLTINEGSLWRGKLG